MATVEYAHIQLPDRTLYPYAQETLAELFDLAVNECGLSGHDTVAGFFATGLDRQFELLNPVYVAGKSPLDLLDLIVRNIGANCVVPQVAKSIPLVDYWVGWIVAFCQLETGVPYRRIFEAVPYDEIAASYNPLHEAPESKFVEVFEPRIRDVANSTRLAVQRKIMGLSQAELAESSGVSLRSIQMYEQKNKNINRASSETLLRLSRALCCSMEDLMEL